MHRHKTYQNWAGNDWKKINRCFSRLLLSCFSKVSKMAHMIKIQCYHKLHTHIHRFYHCKSPIPVTMQSIVGVSTIGTLSVGEATSIRLDNKSVFLLLKLNIVSFLYKKIQQWIDASYHTRWRRICVCFLPWITCSLLSSLLFVVTALRYSMFAWT